MPCLGKSPNGRCHDEAGGPQRRRRKGSCWSRLSPQSPRTPMTWAPRSQCTEVRRRRKRSGGKVSKRGWKRKLDPASLLTMSDEVGGVLGGVGHGRWASRRPCRSQTLWKSPLRSKGPSMLGIPEKLEVETVQVGLLSPSRTLDFHDHPAGAKSSGGAPPELFQRTWEYPSF